MTFETIGRILEVDDVSDEDIDEFLAHFGVKGMRWGKRRQEIRDERDRLNSNLVEAKEMKKAAEDNYSFAKYQKQQFRKERLKSNLRLAGGTIATAAIGAALVTAYFKSRPKNIPVPIKKEPLKYIARGKNWFVETNDEAAFNMTLKTLRERGQL